MKRYIIEHLTDSDSHSDSDPEEEEEEEEKKKDKTNQKMKKLIIEDKSFSVVNSGKP